MLQHLFLINKKHKYFFHLLIVYNKYYPLNKALLVWNYKCLHH